MKKIMIALLIFSLNISFACAQELVQNEIKNQTQVEVKVQKNRFKLWTMPKFKKVFKTEKKVSKPKKVQKIKKVQKPKQIEVHIQKHTQEYPIDIAMCSCLENSSRNKDIKKCADIATRAWEKEIVKDKRQIQEQLPQNQYKLFNSSQNLWQKYYKKQRKLIIKSVRKQDGSMNVDDVNFLINEMVRQRALDIKLYRSLVNVEK